MRARRHDRRDDRDRGATSLELVVVVPVLLSVLALLFAYGRQAQVSGALQAAARDGARTASLSRSYAEADARVGDVVRSTLRGTPSSCQSTAGWSVGDPVDFVAGNSVTVRVWCTRSVADLGLPLPSAVLTRSFTSTLDPYRGTR